MEEHPFYDSGLFPSQRYWFKNAAPVEDNNVFTTASIAFILRLIQERLESPDSILTSIINKSVSNFHKYSNRNGEATYNFWQTSGEDIPFPNGSRLLSRKAHRLPDDYDDTSIIELAKGDEISAMKVREKMVSYALRDNRKPVEQTPSKYKNYKAYEVFFVDKMEQQYDLVVMCNVLTFVFRQGYGLNSVGVETVELMKQMVEDSAHMTRPDAVAPSYRTTSWILYHIARLMTFDNSGLFNDLRTRIVADIQLNLRQTDSEMEKILLYTSLYRLGESPKPEILARILKAEIDSFTFFQFKPTQLFGMLPVMKWKSQAFNWTLVLEFLTYSQMDLMLE